MVDITTNLKRLGNHVGNLCSPAPRKKEELYLVPLRLLPTVKSPRGSVSPPCFSGASSATEIQAPKIDLKQNIENAELYMNLFP